MQVKEFFDPATYTLTYVVYDETTRDAVIIDPVWDYEPQSSTLSDQSVQQLISFVRSKELKPHYILETHAHADHLTSAQKLKKEFPSALTGIHENIRLVQDVFKGVFNFDNSFDTTGKNFDILLKDRQMLSCGSFSIEVLHTPGHTPACVSFYVNSKILFTGDAIFMPDYGTGRCDFPKGSATELYNSIHSVLYKLPDSTEVYVGHDYQPGGRTLAFKTTIGEQKRNNIQLKTETSLTDFVSFREARDSTLMAPKLLLESIQVNVQNGILPKPEANGVSYLKLPIRAK